ncbi:MAG: hypothetical protein HRU19_16245 [Pseudobacteriovorax sp.]|nr:hypothetical protein [Pseudobacteriovorax sp.]
MKFAVLLKFWLFALIAWVCLSVDAYGMASASRGIVDASQEPIKLREGWSVVWGEFVDPASVSTRQDDPMLESFQQFNPDNKKQAGVKRYASFYQHFILDPTKAYGFYFPEIRGASRVFINGELVSEQGVLGTHPEDDRGETNMRPKLSFLDPGLTSATVVIHNSSFDMYNLGPMLPILAGERSVLTKHRHSAQLRDLFALSAVLIMSFYHFALYFLRRDRKEPLLFGVVGLLLTVMTGIRSEGGLGFMFFDPFPTRFYYTTEFLTFPLAVMTMMLYVKMLYPDQIKNWLVKMELYSGVFYVLSILSLGYWGIETVLIPYQFIGLGGGFVCLAYLVKAAIDREAGSKLFVFGFSAMLFGAVNYILKTNSVIETQTISHMTLFIFILGQSIILSQRFALAFKMLEVARSKIRRMNEGLEKTIKERTATIRMIIDNVQSGFLIVNEDLTVGEGFTQSCHRILGAKVAEGVSFIDFFDLNERDKGNLINAFDQVFSDMMPESVTTRQIRDRLPFGDRQVKLEISVIRDQEGGITSLLLTVNDVTELSVVETQAELRKTLLKILQSKISFKSLLRETFSELDEGINHALPQIRYRNGLHTMKGNFASYGLDGLVSEIHKIEDLPKITAVEFATLKGILETFLETYKDILSIDPMDLNYVCYSVDDNDFESLKRQLMSEGASQRVITLCQNWIDVAKKVSFGDLLGPVQKTTERLAKQLGKEVRVNVVGHDEAVDAEKLQYVVHSLVHLIRNSIDHGIEYAEDRGGKDPVGTIDIELRNESYQTVISIRDDGAGIDLDRIRDVAEKRNIIDPDAWDQMSEQDKLHLIFTPGFSTSDEVSSLSGRGVGMSACEEAVLEMNGEIQIKSEFKKGVEFSILLPKTNPEANRKLA